MLATTPQLNKGEQENKTEIVEWAVKWMKRGSGISMLKAVNQKNMLFSDCLQRLCSKEQKQSSGKGATTLSDCIPFSWSPHLILSAVCGQLSNVCLCLYTLTCSPQSWEGEALRPACRFIWSDVIGRKATFGHLVWKGLGNAAFLTMKQAYFNQVWIIRF